jgi:hypothetical protein
MTNVHINTSITKTGIRIFVNKKKYLLNYPQNIWTNLPFVYRQILAENLTVFFTQHFAYWKDYSLTYEFAPPIFTSMFDLGVLMSLPETTIEFSKYKHKTSQLIKKWFNSQFHIKYLGNQTPVFPISVKPTEKNVIIPFTFGKDSLLTYAICNKFGYDTKLFFMEEPYSQLENLHRQKIYKDFEAATGSKIIVINNSLGNLRQNGKEMWGWDMLQMQYATILIPYVYDFRAGYLFFANEQNTNETEIDSEGFTSNLYFEQSRQWMLKLNHLYRYFGLTTHIGSIISPIYELVVTYMLHREFPEIGKFQISCEADNRRAKTKRWCGTCNECGRMYLFLEAIGTNPKTVGFDENLLNTKRYGIFHIFDKKEISIGNNKFINYYGEWMLAFWLAYNKGVKGHLISQFKKYYLKNVEKQLGVLVNKYLTYYPDPTLPQNWQDRLGSYYKSVISRFRREVRVSP